MNDPKDMTQDWPRDPDNDELARLAEHLQNAPPALPTSALVRVEQRIHEEFDRIECRQRWRRVAFGWSIAASMLLAVSGYVQLRMRDADVSTPIAKQAVTPIDDRIVITIGTSQPSASDEKALVRLDEYRSLFAD
jgi:hypothetical protein